MTILFDDKLELLDLLDDLEVGKIGTMQFVQVARRLLIDEDEAAACPKGEPKWQTLS